MSEALAQVVSQQALRQSASPIESAVSLPPECYTSERVAEAELSIFDRSWLGIGRSDMVSGNGEYRTLDIAGRSVILVRDGEGVLRAFANTCRHRGAQLLEGAGSCRTIQCPFHAWTYALDGSLAAAPRMRDVPGFDRDVFGLTTYRVAERLGFVFICFNSDTRGVDETLGDFAPLHAPWPLESLVTTRRRELEVGCNWKAFLEVFNEYYHLPYVHPESLGGLYADPEPVDATVGSFTTQFGLTDGTGALLRDQQERALPPMPGLEGREAHGVRYTWVFPTMTFAAGTEALWVYEAYPLGASRCRVVQSACFPPATLEAEGAQEKVAAYHERLDAALAEDLPALENQQRGMAHPDAARGPFQPLLEPSVAAFGRWYATELGGQLPDQQVTRPAV